MKMHNGHMGKPSELFVESCPTTGLLPKFARLRRAARDHVSELAFDYVDGAALDEITMRKNRESWQRTRLLPRVLNRPIKNPNISCELFGIFRLK